MLTLIWAQTSNGVIGANGGMPWHCPEDLKHFNRITSGKVIIMGRKTWESLPRRPLPNRYHYVVGSQKLHGPGFTSFDSFEKILEEHDNYANSGEWFVIGGAQLFKAAMPHAHKLIVTKFDFTAEGDTFAPSIDTNVWQKTDETLLSGTSHIVETWTRR